MSRHKQHSIGKAAPDTEVGHKLLQQIQALPGMCIAELKARWMELFGSEPPRHSKRSFLAQSVAWEIQAKTLGKLKPAIHRQLLQAGRSAASEGSAPDKTVPNLRPGVKLIRVWKGVTHHVLVTEDGFLWQDRSWRSLSVIAREITGTPWSGPVFFGLKKSKAGAGKVRSDPEIEASSTDHPSAMMTEAAHA